MEYIALKPNRFSGKNYKVDDLIPGDKIAPHRVKVLIQKGYIAPTEHEETLVAIPVLQEDGEFVGQSVALEKVCDVLSLLQMPAADVIPAIQEIEDEELLNMIYLFDKRVGVIKIVCEKLGREFPVELADGEQKDEKSGEDKKPDVEPEQTSMPAEPETEAPPPAAEPVKRGKKQGQGEA